MIKTVLKFLFSVVFLVLFWPFFLYKSFGKNKIKSCKNSIFIANHYSDFDPFLIKLLLLGKKIRFVATAEVKKKLLPRFIAWLFDCFYFDDSLTSISTYRKIIDFLSKGGSIVIFPEGFVNPRRYGFLDFKNGASFLAKRAKADIVPIYIYPESGIFKKSKIFIGDIITFKEYSAFGSYDGISAYLLSKVMDLSAEKTE